MRPDQCGTAGLCPNDPIIVGFRHHLIIRHIMTNPRSRVHRQLTPGPRFHAGDFVKVVDNELRGRWGWVHSVHDFRDFDPESSWGWVVMVKLFAVGNGVAAPFPPGPLPFGPEELAPLFAGEGDWVRRSRVVSRQNWPRQRPEAIA